MRVYSEIKKYQKKIKVTDINKHIYFKYALVLFASFEARSTTLANYIDTTNIMRSYAFRNEDPPMNEAIKKNFDLLYEKVGCVDKVVSLMAPDRTADIIYSTISDIIKESIKNIIIDISTFTHEALLILLQTLKVYQTSFDEIKLIYNGASRYGAWLSKGCQEIRNVIGYPGYFNPSYKNHMIILTGFERERATQLVRLFEPDILSIGNASEAIHPNHIKTMKKMKNEFNEWFGNLGVSYTSFDFSCRNITSTMRTIQSLLGEKENIYLVPLNSKLSTVATALVAFQNPKVQIVYPIPETYNSDYATPSEHFTIIDFKQLLKFINC